MLVALVKNKVQLGTMELKSKHNFTIQISLTRSWVMAASVQHVFTSVSHTHMVLLFILHKVKLQIKGNGCNCPHYVIKIPQFEHSSDFLQGIYLFY